MFVNGCALAVQMSIIGLKQLGSSRLAGLMPRNPGPLDPWANRGEPHSGQNPRRDVPPCRLTWWCLGVPVIATAFSGTMKTEENPPPLARWQSRQWQLSEKSGATAHSYRMAPHAHPPVSGRFMRE